jgi:uncharacterized membrane protein (DUF485 family)
MTSETTPARTPTEPSAAAPQAPGAPDPAALVAMEADPRFAQLRSRFRSFVFPMTAAFLVWYLLYVLLSAYARDFMATKVVGNVNVALVFGLLQFASTFLIAWWYSRFARRRLDPVAAELREDLR